MSEHIDVERTDLLRGEIHLDKAADHLEAFVLREASGRLNAPYGLGHRKFAPTRRFPSA